MKRAEHLARLAHPHPNPRVGAVVITDDGRPVGEGHHLGPGQPHAEVNALAEAGEKARGATLVVTLEPCNHHGRTPPCTEAILDAGLKRVVVGSLDPDNRVSGAGIARLRQAGIEVETGIGKGDEVDPAYFHHRKTGRPMVTLKLAATLDGQVAASDGSSQWITSEEARADAHFLRAESDGVVIGAGTLRLDDPQLDVRLPDFAGPQPRPVVIAGSQPLPESARLWARQPLIVSVKPSAEPYEVLVVKADSSGLPDLAQVIERLGERGLLALLVEGGPRLAAALLSQGLVDRGVLYVGAMLAAGVGRPLFDRPWPSLDSARPVTIERVTNLGPDLRIDFTPR